MTEQTSLIPFHSWPIEAVVHQGEPHIVIRRACEHLGLQEGRQQQRLRATAWATAYMLRVVAVDGKEREAFCLPLRSLPMWLATINPRKVRPECRAALEAYQKEATDVLYRHFLGNGSQEVQDLRAENERLRAQLKLLPQADQEEIVNPGPLAQFGISIGKGMTTPTNPYKRPASVWRVRAPWNDRLNEAFKRCWGRWYRAGKCWAFYEDPRRLLMMTLSPDEFYAQAEARGNA